MREELAITLEELNKARTQAFISSMLEGDDIEGEYTDPILSPNLTANPDSNLWSSTTHPYMS